METYALFPPNPGESIPKESHTVSQGLDDSWLLVTSRYRKSVHGSMNEPNTSIPATASWGEWR